LTSSLERTRRAYISDLEADRAAAYARTEMLEEQLNGQRSECEGARKELRKYERAWSSASARLDEAQKNLVEQKTLVEEAKGTLSQSFRALAADALAKNNQGFLVLAEQKFKALKTEATHDLDLRKDAIQALVKPVEETLEQYQKVTTELEEKRQKDMGSLGEQLRSVASTQSLLHAETNRLVNALKSPQVRGRWGEIALRKTAELAGMAAYCDFCEQETAVTDEGRWRPDLVVKLPTDRNVVVDSKVPLGGFLEALEAHTDDQRMAALEKHAKQVATHIAKLAAKEYWHQFDSTPEFVVLFIPNDSFLAAAAEQDPELVESALSKKVVLATPTTFVALLRAIEFGWRQRIAVENAELIRNLGQEFSDRFAVLVEHLTKIGTSLGKAIEAYNSAVASFEGRVLPAARRFRTLGAGGRKVVEELQPVEHRTRALNIFDEVDIGRASEPDVQAGN
jgi:DNA recombination protein RmuC